MSKHTLREWAEPNTCPRCGDTDLDWPEPADHSDGCTIYSAVCRHCHLEFREEYTSTFTGNYIENTDQQLPSQPPPVDPVRAAAPELLTVLKDFVAAKDGLTPSDFKVLIGNLQAKATVAIARAEPKP